MKSDYIWRINKEKNLVTSSQPTSPIQKLNSLMQKIQDLQSKESPFTKSIFHVDFVPRVTHNIFVNIGGKLKLINPPPQTSIE